MFLSRDDEFVSHASSFLLPLSYTLLPFFYSLLCTLGNALDVHYEYNSKRKNSMTRKIHHLVAASDGKYMTQLTNIYAETYEQALQEAQVWHKDFSHLPILTVKAQPQGFQAGFCRLPGVVEETTVTRWRVKEVLAERGMSMKQAAAVADVSYSTVRRLCRSPLHVSTPSCVEKLAHALAIPLSHMSETVSVTTEVQTLHEL